MQIAFIILILALTGALVHCQECESAIELFNLVKSLERDILEIIELIENNSKQLQNAISRTMIIIIIILFVFNCVYSLIVGFDFSKHILSN